MHTRFVFLDTNGRRWNRFRIIAVLGACVALAGFVIFIRSLIVSPRLTSVQHMSDIKKSLRAIEPSHMELPPSRLPPAWMKPAAFSGRVSSLPSGEGNFSVRLGFYAGWDPASYASLEKHGQLLTHIAPEWFSVSGVPAELSATPDELVLDYARDHDLKFMPLVTNMQRQWQPESIEALLVGDVQRREKFCEELVQNLEELDAAGAVIDFQEIDPFYRDAFADFICMIAAALHEEGLELWLCIPPGNDIALYDLDTLARCVDRFVALLFDENGEHDIPGPIASMKWFRTWLDVLRAHGDPQQWVVGIGAYGYDWKDGEPAEIISFGDCMARAAYAGEGQLENDPDLVGPHFTYTASGTKHTVWFLDAVTFYNHVLYASAAKTGGVALYRLGCEDPSVWRVLEKGLRIPPELLHNIPADDLLAHIGQGDFISVSDERRDGMRTIQVDADGWWHERYITYPGTVLFTHRGSAAYDKVALTFDDGPDPEWTPKILDILKQYGVHAAFFVTGANARHHPDIVMRIIAEGHELGNHTYNHAELTGLPSTLVRLELNATQRIIESITGHSTILFRPPYNADRRPGSTIEIEPLLVANEIGYLYVSQSIDTEDWNASGSDEILQRVKQRRPEGSVLLLHDGGGDRSATCAALPGIIDYLRRRGDQIVPLHVLLGIAPEALMPPFQKGGEGGDLRIASTGLRLMHWFEQVVWAFMIASTALIFCRALILALLAYKNRRGPLLSHSRFSEPVSVLIAAHNEEKVIASTLGSVLTTTYPGGLEVIVIDDGSQDQTATIVQEIAERDRRVRLLKQPKSGKAAALNRGLQAASHQYIVMLDADTQLLPQTIGELVRLFDDPSVGAVSGHIRVGNTNSWITRFQELEYICGFNLDRRAYDRLNCITVAPGALSAFRREALQQAGGLSDDTLAEDTDLTLTLHRLGYTVRFAPNAVAFTEAPKKLSALVRQRVRWAFGTLQCLWKHGDLLLWTKNPALGFFSLPSVWLFHFFFVAMIPFVDLMLLVSLATGAGHAIADYGCAFIMLDVLIAAAACCIDRTPVRYAGRMVLMRFLYRPILAWAVWVSFVMALKGVWVGWGIQERSGLVLIGEKIIPSGVE